MSTLEYQTPSSPRNVPLIMTLLSVMMFLEFFVWGAWYVTMSTFMTEQKMTTNIGLAYMLCPIAAIISPFFLGMIADRFFSSEKVLAVLMIIGGAAMFLVPGAARQGTSAFLGVILIHAMCYMPTLGLTNTIAFANMTNQEKQFPLVRVFGTLGWIVAGLIISFTPRFVSSIRPSQTGVHLGTFYLVFEGIEKTAGPFLLAGGAAVIMGLFSFALPHTPPPARGKQASIAKILGADALALFKSPSFVVFALASFLICIPLAAYYAYAGRLVADLGKPVGSTMSIGQAAEVIFMLLMPLFFAKLGVKWMLALGMLSWVARYALFAAGAPHAIFWMIIAGIALHGMCYDFFFVTGFIYTDQRASKDIRGQAQGLLVLITQGLGLGIGAYLTGEYFNRTVGAATGTAALSLYPKFWWVCAAFALAVLIIFVAFFRDDSKEPAVEPSGFEAVPAAPVE